MTLFLMRRLMSVLAVVILASTAARAQQVPGIRADIKFDQQVQALDLDNASLEFSYKTGKHQGSSVGFHVSQPGHRKSGTFSPSNTSNNLESEVVSYRLSRFLGISDIYNPVSYYRLGPKASVRFRDMLRKQYESDPDRRRNHATTLAELNSHPTYLLGIYRHRPRGSRFSANGLSDGAGHLNTGHPLAGFIRANGPLPSEKLMSLSGVKGQRKEFPKPAEAESELARQFSNILLIDQLMGQWDRFVNNLEAYGDADGRLHFIARDNGGATVDDWEWHNLYDAWLSRYDRVVIERLRSLHAFLNGTEKQFAGFDDPAKWQQAVGFIKTSSFDTFKRKLTLLVEKKLPELEKHYGPRTYFAAPAHTAINPVPQPGAILVGSQPALAAAAARPAVVPIKKAATAKPIESDDDDEPSQVRVKPSADVRRKGARN